MTAFLGKWKFESSLFMAKFLAEFGYEDSAIAEALGNKPSGDFQKHGDRWRFIYTVDGQSYTKECELGVPFSETSTDGRKVKCCWRLENDELVNDEEDIDTGRILHERISMVDGKMVYKATVNGVTGTRIFARTE